MLRIWNCLHRIQLNNFIRAKSKWLIPYQTRFEPYFLPLLLQNTGENENSVFKIFFLRITGELAKKWNNAKMQNWAKVLNQLSCLDETSDRIARYIR